MTPAKETSVALSLISPQVLTSKISKVEGRGKGCLLGQYKKIKGRLHMT